ncbi:MAG: CRISPR-associated protein Csm6 [Lachnospiraceae bacterium]|nr:CRISPR-associated protein Csm6 [Lachnospiraceae bacterium]
MSRKILFSPIGGTDPIKYYRDGSMLHICRHYRPDIVYLYLSQEMLAYHKKDNRYIDAVNRLGKSIGHPFEVVLIERQELINVQQYDVFYQDFRNEIRKIESGMEQGDELLVNLASGTPAMKSALLVMATLAEYRFKPIQVSTPQGKMNAKQDDREDYDAELIWEMNEDNDSDAPNRCEEIQCLNLMKMLKIEAIKKHIWAYDYAAALSVADEIKQDIPEDAFCLIQIADARVKLNLRKISALMKNRQHDIYPVKEGDKQKIFEYALGLQIKFKRQEFADFIRGITPLVVDLLENILKKECKINISDACSVNKEGMRKWDREKLQKLGLLQLLDNEYNGDFRSGPVYSGHIAKIIQNKCSDSVLVDKVKEIASIEGKVRNPAAHEIISVTDEWIRQETGKTAQDILSLVKYLVVRSGIQVKEEHWKSYDAMNQKIEHCLL